MPDNLSEGINQILHSGNLTYGQYAKQFEEKLQTYIGNPNLFTTSNNNYALLIALNVIDLKENEEVIASPMSCLASNQPVISLGGKMVWADIDPTNCALDPEDVKRKITSKTKAILHYHWCGYPGYIDEINAIGKQHGIPVIDDAIESFGSEYKGKKMGNTESDITCFSFQAVRLPTTIDGGAISFKDPALYEKAILMRDYGIDRKKFRDALGEISPEGDIKLKGYNALMNEISGYVGCQQMNSIEELIAKQQKNGATYNAQFEASGNKYLKPQVFSLPNYWVYTLFDQNPLEKIKEYRAKGFYASKVHLRNDEYSCFGSKNNTLKGVNEFEKTAFSIPSGWWI